ncbi:MAG: F0F1 ATP synthase subunit epsilon [Nitrospiraceae bacterium]|nr:F0F1 ATP synthase subunit epsilon [Nitrospiraceae bacterium]
MDKLRLEIVTPRGAVFSGEVDEVHASGSEGDFGVFPGHAPLMSMLRVGALIARADGKPNYFFVGSGFAEVSSKGMIILADSSERAEDIDVARAMAAKQRAEERLAKIENMDFARAQSALERAMARIRIAEERARKG